MPLKNEILAKPTQSRLQNVSSSMEKNNQRITLVDNRAAAIQRKMDNSVIEERAAASAAFSAGADSLKPVQRVVKLDDDVYNAANLDALKTRLSAIKGMGRPAIAKIVEKAKERDTIHKYSGSPIPKLIPPISSQSASNSPKKIAKPTRGAGGAGSDEHKDDLEEGGHQQHAAAHYPASKQLLPGYIDSSDEEEEAPSVSHSYMARGASSGGYEDPERAGKLAAALMNSSVKSPSLAAATTPASAYSPSPSAPLPDSVREAHKKGRLLAHMISGLPKELYPKSAPALEEDKYHWDYNIKKIFTSAQSGGFHSSHSLIPKRGRTGKRQLYSPSFGLLSTPPPDDQIIAMGHNDLGTNVAKKKLAEGNSNEDNVRFMKAEIGKMHTKDLATKLSELNDKRGAVEGETSTMHNEVYYGMKPENLRGIIINSAVVNEKRIGRDSRRIAYEKMAGKIKKHIEKEHKRQFPNAPALNLTIHHSDVLFGEREEQKIQPAAAAATPSAMMKPQSKKEPEK